MNKEREERDADGKSKHGRHVWCEFRNRPVSRSYAPEVMLQVVQKTSSCPKSHRFWALRQSAGPPELVKLGFVAHCFCMHVLCDWTIASLFYRWRLSSAWGVLWDPPPHHE
jgi:hypothetical protein